MTTAPFDALPIVISKFAPKPTRLEKGSPEWVERYVRHGLSDVLEWCGEEVGAKPDEVMTQVLFFPDQIVMHPECAAIIKGLAV